MSELDFNVSYASHRVPMMGRNAVATSQPLAAQAGMRMLQQGGNAVDAAIASAMALTVLEPSGNGLGSDAFAIIWDGKKTARFECLGPLACGMEPGTLCRTRCHAGNWLGSGHRAGRGFGVG
jgi:gamma-glutamyltranspeptidase